MRVPQTSLRAAQCQPLGFDFSALFLGDLLTLFSGFREADSDRLFATLYLTSFATSAALRGSPLVSMHLALHFFLAAARVSSLRCLFSHLVSPFEKAIV